MGRRDREDVIDGHRRTNIDEYVDVIGNFTLSDLRTIDMLVSDQATYSSSPHEQFP